MFLSTIRRNKENNNQKKELSITDLYLEYVNYYVSYQGYLRYVDKPLDNIEFYKEWAGKFYSSAMYFVNYLEKKYPNTLLTSDEVIDINLEEMLNGIDDDTRNLFFKPSFPSLIYIDQKLFFTHFHTDGKVINEAEEIEILPGLCHTLATKKINKIFNGLTPIEARELLKQMGIYPKYTELDCVIDDYHRKEKVNQSFLKSIICILIMEDKKYGIKRGRLFADSLGINFNFEPFERQNEQNKKLEKRTTL